METVNNLNILFCGGFVLLFMVFFSGFFVIQQQSCGVIERFGKFHRIVEASLHWKIPIIDELLTKISFRIHQLDVAVETKTLDNVFVNVVVAVQYKVLS